MRVPVINYSAALWPFRGICEGELIKNSKWVAMTVYGDRDSKVGASFGIKGDDTNLVILDSKGTVSYFHTRLIAGEGETVNALKRLLKDLVTEHRNKKKNPRRRKFDLPVPAPGV